jgi:hypothetical protein
MLLLGALFALFLSGFWLYCLVDVALTPGSECRGLPKAAWIVVVAGTFVIGAAAWLAARHPAGVTLAPAPPGFKARGNEAAGDPDDRPPPFPLQLPLQRRGRRARRSGRPDPSIRVSPDYYGDLDAEAAALRHPAGRSRPRRPSSRPTRPSRPQGPDDDPEFLRSLDRAIRGAESGDDPAGWTGEEP